MDTALVQSSRDSSPKRSYASKTACVLCGPSWASRLLTNPWRVRACKKERGGEREVWYCASQWLCLPASWAAASQMRSRDAALCAYLTLSLTHALFSSCSLTHSLTRRAVHPPLLSSSSYITGYACVSCCSLIALRAVCNHWKEFPSRVHKVEFTDGDTIQPALQASPPSLGILQSVHLSPPSLPFITDLCMCPLLFVVIET